jgi:hypothetical protein
MADASHAQTQHVAVLYASNGGSFVYVVSSSSRVSVW